MNLSNRVNGHKSATPAAQWPHVHDKHEPPSLRKSPVVKLEEGWLLPSLWALDPPNDEDNQ